MLSNYIIRKMVRSVVAQIDFFNRKPPEKTPGNLEVK